MDDPSLLQNPQGPIYTRKGFRPWWYWIYKSCSALAVTAFLSTILAATVGWPIVWPISIAAAFGLVHFLFQFAVVRQLKSDLLRLQKCGFQICPFCTADLPATTGRSLCPKCQSPFTLPALRYLWEKSYRAQLGDEAFMKSFRLHSNPRSPGSAFINW